MTDSPRRVLPAPLFDPPPWRPPERRRPLFVPVKDGER